MTQRRDGSVLIIALWIISVLAGLVLVLTRSMRVELLASANLVAAAEAGAVERGAEQYVLYLVTQEKDAVFGLDESYFAGVQVGDGYFWILKPDHGDRRLTPYGLVDEGSKVNISTASSSVLQGLPGVTQEIAAAITDWRDPDSDPSTGGAEDEFYLMQADPYRAKNGAFETVEELLLVRGVTPDLLFGTLRGSALAAAPMGQSTLGASPGFVTDPTLARGIFDFLTVYTSQPNTSADGQQRVNVNGDETRQVETLLGQVLGEQRTRQLRDRLRPRPPFRDVFDFCKRLDLTQDERDQLMDLLTTSDEQRQRGLINVNTAPREVLAALPGIDENDADALISSRVSAGTAGSTAIAWVADALGDKAIGIGNLITGRALQYSADILATSATGRSFQRCRIVVDAQSSPPRIVHRRDLTQEGWPLDPRILLSLRSGGMGGGLQQRMGGGWQ